MADDNAAVGSKRKLVDDGAIVVSKRQKTEEGERSSTVAGAIIKSGPTRTSNLQAPIMQLTGHGGAVLDVKFSPDGNIIASASHDKNIFLWRTYGQCENYAVLKGHQNAVLEVCWNPEGTELYSVSADCTASVWNAETGGRVRKLREHESFVNCCSPTLRGDQMLATGADDGLCKLWDTRKKASVDTFDNKAPVTGITYSHDATQVMTAGLDNDIHVWDIRKAEIIFSLKGHMDTITGVSLSADGSFLLSNAMDNTVRIWDVRPYAPPQRCVKILEGARHSYEKNLIRCGWSPDGLKVASGSADSCVYIWDTTTRKILYKLPGHAGSVNSVMFHPTEPIIASAGSDNSIYLGEIAE